MELVFIVIVIFIAWYFVASYELWKEKKAEIQKLKQRIIELEKQINK